MLSENLFNDVLIEPIQRGANELFVVTGYATAAMAFHHIEEIRRLGKNVTINLLVGMCVQDGMSTSNHEGFRSISEVNTNNFHCYYISTPPPVHSKIYSWFLDKQPMAGFAGSANYTQTAFNLTQREVMTNCSPEAAYQYYTSLLPDTISCLDESASDLIALYRPRTKARIARPMTPIEEQAKIPLEGLNKISVSLLDRNGRLPGRSGLNWGQRPEEGREPNQAYIRLPAEIQRSDFFPPIGIHFTVMTDDGSILICSRAQANGKAIHTPHDNSIIGKYFRIRLGLPLGSLVTLNDLLRYRRTYVDFYKIDDETYYLDFSALPRNGQLN